MQLDTVKDRPRASLREKFKAAQLVLATDLDGTFLGGTDQDRARLFGLFHSHAAEAMLVFVTGRGLETVVPLLSDPLVPRPQFIVADVGATVVRARDLCAVQPVMTSIADRWPGEATVLAALEGFPALVRQDVPQERRCSFFIDDPQVISDELRRAVAAVGCDMLVSANRYLDILPRGVSKGSTLAALIDHLSVDRDRVVVAGDTLNDLSLFHLDLQGVVVGNAEPGLRQATRDTENVFFANDPGAAGVLEGLEHFGFLKRLSVPEIAAPAPSSDPAPIVMVYHRLPFEKLRRGGKTQRREPKSPNGIIPSLLGFFSEGRAGSWVAWSLADSRTPPEFTPRAPVDPERYANLVESRIPLTKDDVELFYKRFSKEAFWPVIFSFPGRAVFQEEHWQHYVEINRIFAERTAAEAQRGALVWVHDYNLWMVPGHLRRLRPDLTIAFFHHTAFPPPDVFNIMPWRGEITASLLQCDYVGFHIPRYVENFVDVVRSYAPTRILGTASCAPRFATYGCALGIDTVTTAIEVNGRAVRLGSHPVGANVQGIDAILQQPQTQQKIAAIRNEIGRRHCILSIERLDYVKGPLEKLEAFERLLDKHPELHGEIVLINVVTPAAPGMEAYRTTRDKVDQAVGRINGRFGRLDWTPVRYFFRSLPFEEVVAHYAVTDVAWITPLRDGLNLVAKEYVATQSACHKNGVLLLSEFAGAAVELHGSLLTNPYDSRRMEEDLHRALTMEEAERAHRMHQLAEIVRANDVVRWGEEFLEACGHGG